MNNPFSLKNKTILVTGASSGIGQATAIECSKMKAIVIVTGRNLKRLQETYNALEGDGHQLIQADLTQADNFDNLVKSIPKIDGLVHSAGIAQHMLFSFLKEQQFDDIMNINFRIPTLLTQRLIKQKKINPNASIVFITSISGIIFSYIGGSVYSASKGALNGLLKGLALEYAPKQIRVNGVMPAMVETRLLEGGDISDEQLKLDKQKYPLKRYGKPEEVAYAVIYLLSGAASWTTGTNILLDGGRTITF